MPQSLTSFDKSALAAFVPFYFLKHGKVIREAFSKSDIEVIKFQIII